MKNTGEYPLVSIVLTTYNGEKYLPQQLDSLFAQTYSNIEIIALDDCSKDNTTTVLEEYASRHHNMTVVKNNVGIFIKFYK